MPSKPMLYQNGEANYEMSISCTNYCFNNNKNDYPDFHMRNLEIIEDQELKISYKDYQQQFWAQNVTPDN